MVVIGQFRDESVHYQNLDCLSANDLNRLLEVVIRQPVARVCVPIGHRRYSETTRIYPLSAALHQDRRRNSPGKVASREPGSTTLFAAAAIVAGASATGYRHAFSSLQSRPTHEPS